MPRRSILAILGIVVSLTLCTSSGNALQPEPNSVFARVIDSGAALSVAIIMPDSHFMAPTVDDDVDILIRTDGSIVAEYRNP